MFNVLLVFLGGGLGSVARFGISEITRNSFKPVFPMATLLSNVISCTILALAVGFFNEKIGAQSTFRILVVTGFCGGFSTFSTFSFETIELLRSGNIAIAVANIIISITVCFGLIYYLTR